MLKKNKTSGRRLDANDTQAICQQAIASSARKHRFSMSHGSLALSFFVLFSLVQDALGQIEGAVPQIAAPRSVDPRITVKLFAAEPEIVTPTGLAVDAKGNVFVIESHTHFRPEGYEGPKSDRILRFTDEDGDGTADTRKVFFQGTTATMSLAIHPDGAVFVATRNQIFRLRDHDGDGTSDETTVLVRLKTAGTYPHNGLSGFAFDQRGHLWFGLGENLGEDYTLEGFDGKMISGGGEGGSIYRCDLNGKELMRFATGFWNPFHMAFDPFGQLFAVDNDPDWRPPCRLLHVVEEGDYGYRFTLGRRGTHPYSSWFGEVPGTLGMVAGTGEAPSGIVCYQSSELPPEYLGHFLTTSWGMHAIERFRLKPDGASFQSQAETVIQGGEDFRPVAIAVSPNGDVYVSDWVKRSYELHGHGRIWKISHKIQRSKPELENAAARFASVDQPTAQAAAEDIRQTSAGLLWLNAQLSPRSQPISRLRAIALDTLARNDSLDKEKNVEVILADPETRLRALAARIGPIDAAELIPKMDPTVEDALPPLVVAELLRRVDTEEWLESAWLAAESDDAFVRQASRVCLDRLLSDEALFAMTPPENDARRIQWALLIRQRASEHSDVFVPQLLTDSNSQVRFIGLRWIGEEHLTDYYNTVLQNVGQDPAAAELFEAYLATLDLVEADRSGADYEQREVDILDKMIQKFVPETAPNFDLFDVVLRRLVQTVKRDFVQELPQSLEANALTRFALAGSDEAVFAMREIVKADHQFALAQLATQPDRLSEKQLLVALGGLNLAEAWGRAAYDRYVVPNRAEDRPLPEVEREVLRQLVGRRLDEVAIRELKEMAELHPQFEQDIQRLLSPETIPAQRPAVDDLAAWMDRVSDEKLETANPDAGELLFFHPRVARCATCHQVNGRGGLVGPDLTHAKQLGRARILESILQPSKEVAPRYTAWMVVTEDGLVQTGVLQTERGDVQYYRDAEGNWFQIPFNMIEQRQPSDKSLMPHGLFENMTDQEIRDLVAFLLSLE